jgi:hypothetical protein
MKNKINNRYYYMKNKINKAYFIMKIKTNNAKCTQQNQY